MLTITVYVFWQNYKCRQKLQTYIFLDDNEFEQQFLILQIIERRKKREEEKNKRKRELEIKNEDLPYEQRDHALYVAFAPYKDPKYSISVVIEHGGSGSKSAAPIAKKVLKKLLERHSLRESIKGVGENI